MSRTRRIPFGSGRELVQHGSKRRLRRVRVRDHLGWGLVLFVAWLLFILFVIVPWVGSHRHPYWTATASL